MMKRTTLLWIVALLLGWLFDFLFWKHTPGINFAIYAVLCLAGGFLVLGMNKVKPSWKSLLLLIPILFLSAMTFIRQEPLSVFLSIAFTLGLMGLLALTYLGGRWWQFSLSDYVVNFAQLVGSMVARPLTFLTETKKQAAAVDESDKEKSGSRSGWKRVWAVLRGLLIALPILVVFSALLSSADLVFAQRLRDLTGLFRLENLPQYIFRGVYILIGAYALAGIILHATQKSQNEKLVGEGKPFVPQFLGFTEAVVVLGAVVLLFSAFAAIQLQYFFGGQTNIGIEGYTYSEYARRGFGELVGAAFFSLLLYLGLDAIAKRQGVSQRWFFSGLGAAMVALVGVMLVSAFQRLLLYEAAYGFSRLRLYTHIFMIWLGALLAAVVLLDFFRGKRLLGLTLLVASLGFVVTLTAVNVDGYIVRQNVARATAGAGFDVPYLVSLSSDSVPALVDEFQSESLPGLTRDAVGAVLVCRARQTSNHTDSNWRSFKLSNWLANRSLEKVQDKLDQYTIVTEDWPISILTPGKTFYQCYEGGWMD